MKFSLQMLKIDSTYSNEDLQSIPHSLQIQANNNIKSINGIESLSNVLQQLVIENCQNLNDIQALNKTHFVKLTRIEVTNCPNIEDVECINAELSQMSFVDTPKISFNFLHLQEQIINLSIVSCKLKNIESIQQLTSVQVLNLQGNQLQNLFDLRSLANLVELDVSDNNLVSFCQIHNCKKITKLNLSCNFLMNYQEVQVLSKFKQLDCLDVRTNMFQLDLLPQYIFSAIDRQISEVYYKDDAANSANEFQLPASQVFVMEIDELIDQSDDTQCVNQESSLVTKGKKQVIIFKSVELTFEDPSEVTSLSFVQCNYLKLKLSQQLTQLREVQCLKSCIPEIAIFQNLLQRINFQQCSLNKLQINLICPQLTHLILDKNRLTDTYFLKFTPNLVRIELQNNSIQEIESNIRFEQLEYLDLSNNLLCSTLFLQYCVKLKYLNLASTNIFTLYPVRHCEQLEYINVSSTFLADANEIQVIKGMKQLHTFALNSCPIFDGSFSLKLAESRQNNLKQLYYINAEKQTNDIDYIKKQLLPLNTIFQPLYERNYSANECALITVTGNQQVNENTKAVLMKNVQLSSLSFLQPAAASLEYLFIQDCKQLYDFQVFNSTNFLKLQFVHICDCWMLKQLNLENAPNLKVLILKSDGNGNAVQLSIPQKLEVIHIIYVTLKSEKIFSELFKTQSLFLTNGPLDWKDMLQFQNLKLLNLYGNEWIKEMNLKQLQNLIVLRIDESSIKQIILPNQLQVLQSNSRQGQFRQQLNKLQQLKYLMMYEPNVPFTFLQNLEQTNSTVQGFFKKISSPHLKFKNDYTIDNEKRVGNGNCWKDVVKQKRSGNLKTKYIDQIFICQMNINQKIQYIKELGIIKFGMKSYIVELNNKLIKLNKISQNNSNMQQRKYYQTLQQKNLQYINVFAHRDVESAAQLLLRPISMPEFRVLALEQLRKDFNDYESTDDELLDMCKAYEGFRFRNLNWQELAARFQGYDQKQLHAQYTKLINQSDCNIPVELYKQIQARAEVLFKYDISERYVKVTICQEYEKEFKLLNCKNYIMNKIDCRYIDFKPTLSWPPSEENQPHPPVLPHIPQIPQAVLQLPFSVPVFRAHVLQQLRIVFRNSENETDDQLLDKCKKINDQGGRINGMNWEEIAARFQGFNQKTIHSQFIKLINQQYDKVPTELQRQIRKRIEDLFCQNISKERVRAILQQEYEKVSKQYNFKKCIENKIDFVYNRKDQKTTYAMLMESKNQQQKCSANMEIPNNLFDNDGDE